jgi:hypothetical protein
MNTNENYQLPEAGGIAFATIYSKTGVPINVTARAITPKDAIKSLMDSIVWAMGEYDMTVEKPLPPAAAAPLPTKDVAIVLEEGNKELAKQLAESAVELPPSRKGPDVKYQTIDADIVEVLPQPDGKTTIKFFGANDKYPRIAVNKWKIESANGLMKYVTSEDMGKAGRYTIKCRVYYTDGSAYTTTDGETRHYKDVEHVRPR